MRITLSFRDAVLWREFRAACIRRGTSASQTIEQFVQEQLAIWHQQEQEHPHA